MANFFLQSQHPIPVEVISDLHITLINQHCGWLSWLAPEESLMRRLRELDQHLRVELTHLPHR